MKYPEISYLTNQRIVVLYSIKIVICCKINSTIKIKINEIFLRGLIFVFNSYKLSIGKEEKTMSKEN